MGKDTPEDVEFAIARMYVAGPDDLERERMLRAYAATLRQQAGRVDEGMVERAREAYFNAANVKDGVFTDPVAMRAALTAALAQNTQGDGEAVATVKSWTNGSYHRNYNIEWHKEVEAGTKLYLHAERARVPDADVIGDAIEVVMEVRQFMESAKRFDAMARMQKLAIDLEQLLAAAPSQPKDAGEVGHG